MFRSDKPPIFADETARRQAGRFGMLLFILTLAIIFASTILAFVVVRLGPTNAGRWPPPDAPPLPLALLASTLVLFLSDATIHVARVAAARGERSTGPWMLVTFVLALGFLATQYWAWSQAARAHMVLTEDLYAWTFYVLTALHAAHVIGGIVPMAIVTGRAFRGAYGPGRDDGVATCALYWHFLDIVWLALYATLWWGSQRW
ncbi:MAG: cytochrome c oxidase subunit 3 [Phycisphaerae bacterium]|nr:cytochrome c oxidase subunit 3 [Phycisphaerae bacterium]